MRTQNNESLIAYFSNGCGPPPAPGEVWSFYDVLIQLNRNFTACVAWVTDAHFHFRDVVEDMLKSGRHHAKFDRGDLEMARKSLEQLQLLEKSLQIPTLTQAVKNACAFYHSDNAWDKLPLPHWRTLVSVLYSIQSALVTGTQHKLFLTLDPSAERYLSEKYQLEFLQTVAEKFPNSLYDFEEARLCMAYGNYTAVVFHLARALESILQKLSIKLEATVQDRNGKFLPWGTLLSNCRDKIDQLTNADEKRNWSETHGLLTSIKDAWRNPTMHPNRVYNGQQAAAILDAVKGFVERLSVLV